MSRGRLVVWSRQGPTERATCGAIEATITRLETDALAAQGLASVCVRFASVDLEIGEDTPAYFHFPTGDLEQEILDLKEELGTHLRLRAAEQIVATREWPGRGGRTPLPTTEPGPWPREAERRRHPRYPIAAPLTLVVAGQPGADAAELVNLSLGGCFLAISADDLEPEREITLSFIAADRLSCAGVGNIVRSAAGEGCGVEFSAVNAGLRAFLARMSEASSEVRRTVIESVVGGEIWMD